MKTDKEFQKGLKRSEIAVNLVNSHLNSLGYNSKVLKNTGNGPDNGDIEIKFRIEVKYSRRHFDSIESFSFDNIFVDEVYKVDKYDIRTLFCYFIVDEDKIGYIHIPRETYPHWIKIKRNDPYENYGNGEMREWYACPSKYLKYYKF